MSDGIKPTRIEREGYALPDEVSIDGDYTGDDVDWDSSPGMLGFDQWKQPVRAATTAAITIATALNNGDTLDGVTLATGDRVLVKDQGASAEQNGIYIVGTTPARADDMDEDAEVLGAVVYVIDGTANAATIWTVTNDTATIVDTDAINWAAFGGSGGGVTVSDEGTPLSTTATTLDFVGAGVTASGTGATKTITIPGGSGLTVEEADGSPTDSAVTKIVFPNGTLAIASHVATYTAAAASDPDPVASVFGTPDTAYEFGTSSLTGLTVIGSAATEDANTTVPGHLFYKATDGSVAWHGRYLASPSTPFTAITKVSGWNPSANYNGAALLVGVANPATGAFVVCSASYNGDRRFDQGKFTNRTTYSSSAGNWLIDPGPSPYLAMVVNSTSSIDYYASRDGRIWRKFISANDPSLTVGSVGVAMKAENAAGFSCAFDYLRIWNSAKTFPGA